VFDIFNDKAPLGLAPALLEYVKLNCKGVKEKHASFITTVLIFMIKKARKQPLEKDL
jgi:hypothetical protein